MNLSNIDISNINPIQNGLFRGCSRIRGGGGGLGGERLPLPKICPTYPTMMKLGTVIPYLKENLKHIKIT